MEATTKQQLVTSYLETAQSYIEAAIGSLRCAQECHPDQAVGQIIRRLSATVTVDAYDITAEEGLTIKDSINAVASWGEVNRQVVEQHVFLNLGKAYDARTGEVYLPTLLESLQAAFPALGNARDSFLTVDGIWIDSLVINCIERAGLTYRPF